MSSGVPGRVFFPPCAGPVMSPPAKLLHGSCIQRMSSEPQSTGYFFRLKVQKAFAALVVDWLHVLKVLGFRTWCFDRCFFSSFFFCDWKSPPSVVLSIGLYVDFKSTNWKSSRKSTIWRTLEGAKLNFFFPHFIFQIRYLYLISLLLICPLLVASGVVWALLSCINGFTTETC